jgi:hypothetical protein
MASAREESGRSKHGKKDRAARYAGGCKSSDKGKEIVFARWCSLVPVAGHELLMRTEERRGEERRGKEWEYLQVRIQSEKFACNVSHGH